MLTNRARYIIIGTFIILAAIAGIYHVYEISAAALLVAAYILWGYFKDGAVVLAAKTYQQNDYVKTALLLANTRNPEKLAKKRRGYYEFMKANLALKREDFPEAERHFQLATLFPLQKTQRVSVYANLATLALMQKDAGRTDAYIEIARGLEPSAKFTAILNSLKAEREKLRHTADGIGSAF